MDVEIIPSILKGTVSAIPAKSELHRALICASFADRETRIELPGTLYQNESNIPDDIRATVSCLQALGAEIRFEPGMFLVVPSHRTPGEVSLDCLESGSTLRFLLPVAAAVARKAVFTGHGRLPERPLSELLSALSGHGTVFSSERLPLESSGLLRSGTFRVPGNISSQYITGLLLAFPLLAGQSELQITTDLRSADYVQITADIMSRFGVDVQENHDQWTVSSSSGYRSPGTVRIGGDWSNAAPFLVMGLLGRGNALSVTGLDQQSRQGDRAAAVLLSSMGGKLSSEENTLHVSSSPLSGIRIDIDPTPDLMPVLAVAASSGSGRTEFTNAGRLRLKESDRIRSTAGLIRSLGGIATEAEDSLTVSAVPSLAGGEVDSGNDHRIVMAAAAASCMASGPVLIRGAEAVRKSYPTFFDDFISLGGVVHVL